MGDTFISATNPAFMEYPSPANALFKQRVKGSEIIAMGRCTVLQYTVKIDISKYFRTSLILRRNISVSTWDTDVEDLIGQVNSYAILFGTRSTSGRRMANAAISVRYKANPIIRCRSY